MRILKSVHHSKRWNGAAVVGFAGSELCNITETEVPIRGKILIQDLENRVRRRCTDFSKSRIFELAVGAQTDAHVAFSR